MTAGFYASKSTGDVLIDDSSLVLSIVHRGEILTHLSPSVFYQGTGYYYSDGAFGGIFKVTYPSAITSSSPPIVALIPMSTAKGCFHAFKNLGSPGNWTGFEIAHHRDMKGWERTGYYGNETGPYTLDQIRPNWQYVACRTDLAPESSVSAGLKIWNASGVLIFDSGSPVMRIVSPLVSWSRVADGYGFVRLRNDWSYGFDGTFGIIASSLSVHLISGSFFASPRIGFSSSAPGKVLMSIGGTNKISYNNLAPGSRGWLDDETRLSQFLNSGGGLNTFAVKVPAP